MSTQRQSIGLAKRLGETSPALSRALSEHVEDNFGDILPHLFLSDVARHAIYLAGQPSEALAATELSRILAELESAFATGDAPTKEAISVSFLEHIERTSVASALGPELEREHNAIEQQRDALNRLPH